ncbi:hypothetical protein L211DRAFT_450159 [Terfezia boudieri ATCC MYA-4762]|uniref:Uncharacterized protein n=1 Tax=Terfezia boudieri ATCC MYA-4762 TaxID=1051890 RepID=A0A3N4L4U5_9PEZI|nr:hypothetical protein L211DRAFT_450159 [Terfezia boudieri ATCC MYA-4762]
MCYIVPFFFQSCEGHLDGGKNNEHVRSLDRYRSEKMRSKREKIESTQLNFPPHCIQ